MAYTSKYDNTVSDLYNQIANRASFSYNANEDALYNAYKDRYMQSGKKTMQDTIGKAAGLTNGYTNSYAQTQGQNAYNETINGLNDKMMETYGYAQDAYQKEGDRIQNLFQNSSQLAQNDFDRYMQQEQLKLQWQSLELQKQMLNNSM